MSRPSGAVARRRPAPDGAERQGPGERPEERRRQPEAPERRAPVSGAAPRRARPVRGRIGDPRGIWRASCGPRAPRPQGQDVIPCRAGHRPAGGATCPQDRGPRSSRARGPGGRGSRRRWGTRLGRTAGGGAPGEDRAAFGHRLGIRKGDGIAAAACGEAPSPRGEACGPRCRGHGSRPRSGRARGGDPRPRAAGAAPDPGGGGSGRAAPAPRLPWRWRGRRRFPARVCRAAQCLPAVGPAWSWCRGEDRHSRGLRSRRCRTPGRPLGRGDRPPASALLRTDVIGEPATGAPIFAQPSTDLLGKPGAERQFDRNLRPTS